MPAISIIRKIPTTRNPWVATVNGKTYSYEAGTEQEVPAEVAVLIDAYWNKQEVDYPETGISFNDLRDRPFGEDTEVLFDQRVEFAAEYVELDGALPISDGDLVKVTWNGVEYECTATDEGQPGSTLVYFGNPALMGGPDNGIPFAISTGTDNGEGMFVIIAPDFVGQTVSVKVEGVAVKTLDPKFIPAGVSGGVVIVQDSAMASGVAVASQAPATATMNAAQIAESVKAGKTVYFLMVDVDSYLLPLTSIYRYLDLVSETMAVPALPDPYVLFGCADEDGGYSGVKVFPDGSYNNFSYTIKTE